MLYRSNHFEVPEKEKFISNVIKPVIATNMQRIIDREKVRNYEISVAMTRMTNQIMKEYFRITAKKNFGRCKNMQLFYFNQKDKNSLYYAKNSLEIMLSNQCREYLQHKEFLDHLDFDNEFITRFFNRSTSAFKSSCMVCIDLSDIYLQSCIIEDTYSYSRNTEWTKALLDDIFNRDMNRMASSVFAELSFNNCKLEESSMSPIKISRRLNFVSEVI